MSAKPSADVQTSLRWVSRCKGTTFFSFLQDIAQKKSPLVFENTNGDFVSILTKRTFSVLVVSGSSLGVLRVVAR